MLAALCLVLAAACSEQVDQTQVAIDAFEAVHGPVSPYCRERAEALEVDTVPAEQIQSVCGRTVAACLDTYDSERAHATIADTTGEHAIAHETLHLLFRCSHVDDNGDHNHTDAAWAQDGIYI